MGQTNNPVNPGTAYAVTVTRQDERYAVAAARGHELTLNVKREMAQPVLMPPKPCWQRWGRA